MQVDKRKNFKTGFTITHYKRNNLEKFSNLVECVNVNLRSGIFFNNLHYRRQIVVNPLEINRLQEKKN